MGLALAGRARWGASAGRLLGAIGALVLTCAAAPPPEEPGPAALAARFPEEPPRGRLVLTVMVRTGEAIDVGQGPDGVRRIVPIIGGSFSGEGGLAGVVLPGGADRQRLRPDGVRELDATYELRTADGAILMVHNQVIVDAPAGAGPDGRYVRSVVRIVAPQGRYDWLNRRLLVGTLTSLRPAQPLVLLRFYELR